jgi:RNA polymerase primary sigma factor
LSEELWDLERGNTIREVTSRLEHLLNTTVDGATGKPLVCAPRPPAGFVWGYESPDEAGSTRSQPAPSPPPQRAEAAAPEGPEESANRRVQIGNFVIMDKQSAKSNLPEPARDDAEPHARKVKGASPQSEVAAYMRRVSKYPRLTREEEVLLGQAIEIGNKARNALPQVLIPEPEPPKGFVWADFDKCGQQQLLRMADRGDLAFKLLVLTNLGLVAWVARKYFSSKGSTGDGLMDLIQDGNCGLIKSIERWDWRRGLRFNTFATFWIRQHISRGLQTTTQIRIPEHYRQKVENLRRERNAFLAEHHRLPTHEELASRLHMKLDAYVEMVKIEKGTVSCDDSCSCDDHRTILDMIDVSRYTTPDEHLAHKSLLRDLTQLVNELPSNEQFVLENRFGLNGAEPRTLKEVGELLGMEPDESTRSKVGRMQKKALQHLLQTHRTMLEDLRLQMEEDVKC